MPFDTSTLERLDEIVNNACSNPTASIPGTTVVVVGKDGEELFAKAAGKRGVDSEEPMTLDSVYFIASCTKLLTAVAVMQLVEKGTLALDDAAQTESLCPELRALQVLRADGALEEKQAAITLRMLLSHTAGFGYAFFNERVRDWCLAAGVRAFPETLEDVTLPLLFQPGTGWDPDQVGVDWAGLALERATGLRLGDYLQKFVFAPLGIKDMSMIPSREMRSRVADMHARGTDGILKTRDHLLMQPLTIDPDDEAQRRQIFHAGGSGMFAKPQEYCKILAMLLNDGTCPRTGAKLLDKATVEEMFRNQIPDFPDFGRQGIPAAHPDLTNPLPDLYPGWGLTFMQSNGGPTGRSGGTGHWAGMANTWWWCDREHGVAGMVCTQILPFADPAVLGLWFQVETEAYKALKAGR
ncbi:beta-lactamase/transpeptidase-like protein [Apiospora kogelbergensis]|uniref:beta-lactamase/transpeptidase-like protein n=1 Tax=Apiospora kogelbergensis TaxID=1337665 RepID=UPI003131E75A